MERRCLLTVNESFTSNEVLMNLDLADGEIEPGVLMAIDVLSDRAPYGTGSSLRKQPSQEHDRNAAEPEAAPADVDVVRRYLFTVKDMPKDLRLRHPNVELFVPKHIAHAFGMRNGSTVLLTPVSLPPEPLLPLAIR